MDLADATALIEQADNNERDRRAARLVELTGLLGDAPGLSYGQGAYWLFEDVKATWLYGYFTATVLTAHAFCVQQVSGRLRTLASGADLARTVESLETFAELAQRHGVISLQSRARLVELHDAAKVYLSSDLSTYRRDLELRVQEAETYADEHSLVRDARTAL